MMVDIRPAPGSTNYYFYQHATGQIVFCITPSPNAWGDDCRETSDLPADGRPAYGGRDAAAGEPPRAAHLARAVPDDAGRLPDHRLVAGGAGLAGGSRGCAGRG